MSPYAPGMRVLIRDAEFSIQKVDATPDGGFELVCSGISEEVAGHDFRFLAEIDNPVVLKPEETILVAYTSSNHEGARLLIESQYRKKIPNGTALTVGPRAAMDLLDYQLEPARRALAVPRARLLIADGVGLGKTLEAGILVSELIRRGKGRRILVVTVKSMLSQFQKEFWTRFTIPLVRLDSQGIQRTRRRIPANHNPFDYFEKTIISMDTLKNDAEYRVYLEKAWWDIIVIDEAHHASFKGSRNQNNRLAELLANRSDALILLSATPHNGKAESFASLMKMLDPTSIADEREYGVDDIKGLFLRRFKKDIRNQVSRNFPDRELLPPLRASSNQGEETAWDALAALRFDYLDRSRTASGSQRTTGAMLRRISLEKALLSSPMACAAQCSTMLKELEGKTEAAATSDAAQITTLQDACRSIDLRNFGKYQSLLAQLKAWAWTGKKTDDRLVIFTERLETMRFLAASLKADLGLGEGAVEMLHGSLGDTEVQDLVEAFGKGSSPLRLLVATDVASEGINLHYLCHRLVHFDIPWSLMVFQQRNGRIDRYGQERTPLIVYCLAQTRNESIRGDLRVLEILIEKEKEAYRNIGDPASLMGEYEADAESLLTADVIAGNLTVEAFSARLDQGETEVDWFQTLLSGSSNGSAPAAPARPECLLFPDDYSYLVAALGYLETAWGTNLDIQADPATKSIRFAPPAELQDLLGDLLPREIATAELVRLVRLVSDPARINAKIVECRALERAWPTEHFLWSLHPVFPWAADRVRARFRRREAPLVWTSGFLAQGEATYIIIAQVPNRRGRIVLDSWVAVTIDASGRSTSEEGEAWCSRLAGKTLPNDSKVRPVDTLQARLPKVLAEGRRWMSEQHREYSKKIGRELEAKMAELARLESRHVEQLELGFQQSAQVEALREHRLREGRERIKATFASWREWVRESMTIVDEPYVQVLAVFAEVENT